MMKIFFFFLVSLLVTYSSARPFQSTKHTALALRGGDLGPVSGQALAQTLGGLASLDAVSGAFFPRSSMKYFGVDIEKGSQSEICLHGIGASAATVAVSTYLANSGLAVHEAIGYGLVARLLSVALMMLTKDHQHVGMTLGIVGVMWVVLATTTVLLFQDHEYAFDLTKLVSLILAVHGGILYLAPEAFVVEPKPKLVVEKNGTKGIAIRKQQPEKKAGKKFVESGVREEAMRWLLLTLVTLFLFR